jgi:hypothetical protein
MPLHFNTAGPQVPEIHYTLDPLLRLHADEVLSLIEERKYFVLHAPRQTGKTSCLLALRDKINADGQMRALYINIEAAKALPDEHVQDSLMIAVMNAVRETFADIDWQELLTTTRQQAPELPFSQIIQEICRLDPARPLVLFIDEADTLQARPTVTYLSQLRAGYASRPRNFPQSIILCGLKDIRDFRILDENGAMLTTGSAFNILAESLRLGNFSREDLDALYAQHTTATGQRFAPEAMDLIFELTWGQPWMINKFGELLCFGKGAERDRSVTITVEMVQEARERMIQLRTIHLDNLAYRLTEERVHRVIAPMLSGEDEFGVHDPDDLRYCLDLGLVRLDDNKRPIIANPIYREVIPRELTYVRQVEMDQNQAWYREVDGQMNIPKLLKAFQSFYRAHSESDRWFPRYSEAGAQLLMQAWLQRIINGDGQIEREYGLGTKRVDLLIRWPYPQPQQEIVIELKVIRPKDSPQQVLREGLDQIQAYMERVCATEGHLMIFDHRPGVDWESKFSDSHATTPDGWEITLWRC